MEFLSSKESAREATPADTGTLEALVKLYGAGFTITDLRQVVERAGAGLTPNEIYKYVTARVSRDVHTLAYIKLEDTIASESKKLAKQTGIKETYTETKIRMGVMDDAVKYLKSLRSRRGGSSRGALPRGSILRTLLNDSGRRSSSESPQ